MYLHTYVKKEFRSFTFVIHGYYHSEIYVRLLIVSNFCIKCFILTHSVMMAKALIYI